MILIMWIKILIIIILNWVYAATNVLGNLNPNWMMRKLILNPHFPILLIITNIKTPDIFNKTIKTRSH